MNRKHIMVYIGPAVDITPMKLGLGLCDGKEIYFENDGDENVVNVLKKVKTFVLVDIMPGKKYFSFLCPTPEHYWHYIEITYAHFIRVQLMEHNKKQNYLKFKGCWGGEIYYFYSTDYKDISKKNTPLLHNLIQQADILYQYGYGIMDDVCMLDESTKYDVKQDELVNMLPCLKIVIQQSWRLYEEREKYLKKKGVDVYYNDFSFEDLLL